MKNIWFDSPELRLARERQGIFEVTLKASGTKKIANEVESHHFARVLASMKRLGVKDLGATLKAAAEDFSAALIGNGNYFIKRMYFSTQPEMIARWYLKPAQLA
ncbi:hypothetical protein SAMN02745866_00446 [Alteromonadaceae bacterium Bs31]|nr:hypothetical protein SAMN02745866_00446 [Alteromonadaceae bacterium Bs31]